MMEKTKMEMGWNSQSVRFTFSHLFVKELSFLFFTYP